MGKGRTKRKELSVVDILELSSETQRDLLAEARRTQARDIGELGRLGRGLRRLQGRGKAKRK